MILSLGAHFNYFWLCWQVLPAASFKSWLPYQPVALQMTDSGIDAVAPVSLYTFLKDKADLFPDHPALAEKKDGLWKLVHDRLASIIQDRLVSIIQDRLESIIQDRLVSIIQDRLVSIIQDRLVSIIQDRLVSIIQDRLVSIIQDRLVSIIHDNLLILIEIKNKIQATWSGCPVVPGFPFFIAKRLVSFMMSDASVLHRFWSYREYFEGSCLAAKAFLNLGLDRFHGICLMGYNSPEWFMAYFGGLITSYECRYFGPQ